MITHTPPIWTVRTITRVGADGQSQAFEVMYLDRVICSKRVDGPLTAEDHANARLIAAAPELLRACKHLYALVGELQPVVLGEHDVAHIDRIVRASVRLVIARATGEQ